jgi:hypothetical protein
MVSNASAMIDKAGVLGQPSLAPDKGPWDEFSQSIIGVSAVKSDVMVGIEGGPFTQDVQRAFIERRS